MTRAKFQNTAAPAAPLCKKIFLENFCLVCDSLVSADMDIKKCGRKSTYVFMEKQKA